MPSNRPRFRLSLLVVLTVVVGVLAQTSSAEPEDNAPPEAVSDDISTAKGTPGDVNVLVNDSDPDDDPLTVESWTQGNDGSVTCTGAGACVYMPTDPSFHGADSFTYTVADGHGGTAIGDVFVLVTTTNGQPDATDDELVVVEDSFGAVDVLANDSDPDEDPLTLTTPAPDADHGTVSCTSAGVCTYTPDPDFFGTDTFNYEIDDGQGGADTGAVAIDVTPVNDDPNAVNDSLTVSEDLQGSLNVRLNDTDADGDTLLVTTPSPAAAHGDVACLGGGGCTYTPDPDYNGPDSFTYEVSDDHGGTDTATVSITVTPENTAPVADDEPLTTAEDTAGNVNVLAGDTDIDGDTLAVTTPAPGAEDGTVSCTTGGTCTYTPDPDFNGSDSFQYTVSDGRGGSDIGLVSVTVTAAPDAANDTLTASEDGQDEVDVLANDNDALSVTDSTNGAHGTVSCESDGICTYTPAADFNGADAFTYTASDGSGGTDTGSVSVTVTPVNDAPAADDDSLTTTVNTAAGINVRDGDTDVDGDTLTVTAPSDPEHGSVSCQLTGACTYTPDPGYLGADNFTYTVGDGQATDEGLVTVTVQEANAAPVCANVKPSKTALWPPQRQFVVITLSGATDVNPDSLAYDITTVKQDEKTRGIGGAADKGPDAQRLSGKPHQIKIRAERDAKANGRVYSIAYEVSDGRGGTCTGVEKVGVPVKKGKKAVATAKSFNSFG